MSIRGLRRVLPHRRAQRARPDDRGARVQRGHRAPAVPARRRPRLPRRSTAPSATLAGGEAQRIRLASADRQRARRRALRARRAVDRPAPARQPTPDRHARAAARPRQHRARRRARRGDDPRRRPRRRHRARAPGSTAARSSCPGTRRRISLKSNDVDHRRSTCRAKRRSRCPSCAATRARHWIGIKGAREHNLQEHRRARSRWDASSASPASAAAGRARSSTTSCCRALMQKLYRSTRSAGPHKTIEGTEHIDKVIEIDQSPIGRTPRSNPATYTGVFDKIRDAVRRARRKRRSAATSPGGSSFNVKGGRCEACQGDGIDQDRDALPARRVRAVRGLQGHALQPRDARHHVEGQEHRRRART